MALEEIAQKLKADDEEIRRTAVAALAGAPLARALPFIFRAMGDVSWRVRKEAVETLFRCDTPGLDVVEGLIGLLRSAENAGLRNCAVESLERLGSLAVEPLCRHLNDPDADLRKFVIDILGGIGCPSCVPLLLQAMDDPDPNVSVGAVENLGKIGDPRAVPHLVQALSNGDLWLKFTVLDALASIGAPVPLEVVTPLLGENLLKRALYDCLGAVAGADAVPLLIDGLQHGPRNAREAAVVALMRLRGRLSEDRVRDLVDLPLKELKGMAHLDNLIKSLEGGDPLILESLVDLLGLVGDERCVAPLVAAARDERLRNACHRALLAVGKDALSELTSLFEEASAEDRPFIAYVMGDLDLTETVPLLLPALSDDNPELRAACLTSLGRLHPEGVARKVAGFVADPDLLVRKAALEALASFTSSDPEELRAICAELASSAHPSERRDSAQLLAGMKDGERLFLLVKDEDAEVRRAALTALGRARLPQASMHLVMGLMDEEPGVRTAAATALGEAGGDEALEPLLLSLSDPDPWVQCACLKALAVLGSPAALAGVSAVTRDARGMVLIQALKTLAALSHRDALEPVKKALSDPDEEVVEAAIEILCAHENGWIEECAELLAAHRHWGVRRAYYRAVASLRGDAALPILRRAHLSESDALVKGELEKLMGRVS